MCAYPQMPTGENKLPTAIQPALCQYLCGQKSKEVKRGTLMDLWSGKHQHKQWIVTEENIAGKYENSC